MAIVTPYIPQRITVHLGKPDEAAENVTVDFVDYDTLEPIAEGINR